MDHSFMMGGRTIGEGSPCFLIAEAGVNHNGELDAALRLVDVASSAGCDAVKFQTFRARDLVTREAPRARYQVHNTGSRASQHALLADLELPYDDFATLKEHCDAQGILFLSTPHTEDALSFLDPLVPGFKISSGDLTHLPLLRRAASLGKPLILSTGMATLEEVQQALKCIREQANPPVMVLHCTTSYPCLPEEVHLDAMLTMAEELDCPVGYSDHTVGMQVAIMAVTLGAVCIEKHFTLDRTQPGPDHAASLTPEELKELVQALRRVPNIRGRSDKAPTETEQEMRDTIRKSLVAAQEIPAGTVIVREMLAVKRPGNGIEPAMLEQVAGRRAKVRIPEDALIRWDQVE